MKKLIKVLTAGSMCVTLAACGESEKEVEQVLDAEEVYGCSVINVYNAGEYIAEDAIDNFETMYNAEVNYDTFESNELLYTTLMKGTSYDVLVPSDYMIERLLKENMLQPLDKSILTNLDQLSDEVVKMRDVFDEGGVYAVPYFWGSVGIVYNKENVDSATVEAEGWDILHDEQFKGRVYGYDSQRDMFMIAFKALGYSMNTEDSDEILAAYEWLQEMNEKVEPALVTDEVIDDMVNGKMDIAIMYSGDAAYVLSENEDMAYYEPQQGTNVWIDAMVVPANSSCPGLANEFINYMTDYDQAYANSDEVGYTSPNAKAAEELADDTYADNNAYTPRTGYALDEVFHYNENLTKQLADLWTKVKMSVN